MIFISVLIILAIFINWFNGKQDAGNSIAEIELAKYRNIPEDLIRRNHWHKMGLYTYGLTGILIGFEMYKFDYICAILSVLIFWLMRILVFNPVVAKGLGQGFFFISNNGWDGFFKRIVGEKIYYFSALIFFILFTGLLIDKEINL